MIPSFFTETVSRSGFRNCGSLEIVAIIMIAPYFSKLAGWLPIDVRIKWPAWDGASNDTRKGSGYVESFLSNGKITSATGYQFSTKSLISFIAITTKSKIASFLCKFAPGDRLHVWIKWPAWNGASIDTRKGTSDIVTFLSNGQISLETSS